MNSLYASVLNETEKIFLKRKTIAFLIISALIPVGAAFLFSLLQSNMGVLFLSTSNFMILILGMFTSLFLPLFIFTCASDLFAGEIADKTLKITLTKPISRFKVFLSKNISLLVYLLIYLFVIFSASVISGAIIQGKVQINELYQTLGVYLVSVIPMLSLGMIAVFLAQLFKSSSSALTSCIIIYVIGKTIPFLSPVWSKALPFSYTDWYMLWLGSSVGTENLVRIFIILLSYIIIFFSGGFYLFDKKEL